MSVHAAWLRSLVVLLILLPALSASKGAAQDLNCNMSIEADTLLIAEPIWVDLVIDNPSDTRVDCRCLTDYTTSGRFEVTDDTGKKLPHTGVQSSSAGTPYIESGTSWAMTYNLLDFVGVGHRDPPKHLPPGTYEVRYICGGLCERIVESFVVVEPSGDERAAYELYAFARGRHGRAGTLDGAVEVFEEVVTRYPHSRYGEISLMKAISALRLAGRYDGALVVSQRLLDVFPDSGFARDALFMLLYHSTSERAGLSVIESTISRHPGTRAEVFAKQFRSVIEGGKTGFWKEKHLRCLDKMR